MCQTPPENQQQRLEFRHEKGRIQQTMPVSFLFYYTPARADLFKRKTSAVIRRLYMFHEERATSVQLATTDAPFREFRDGLLLSLLRLPRLASRARATGNFSLATREKCLVVSHPRRIPYQF